jgi:hypothetical protein
MARNGDGAIGRWEMGRRGDVSKNRTQKKRRVHFLPFTLAHSTQPSPRLPSPRLPISHLPIHLPSPFRPISLSPALSRSRLSPSPLLPFPPLPSRWHRRCIKTGLAAALILNFRDRLDQGCFIISGRLITPKDLC